MADADAKRQEERVKLFASALSNVGVAAVVAGWIGPSITGRLNTIVVLGAALVGLGFHLLAQCILHYVVGEPSRNDDLGEDG